MQNMLKQNQMALQSEQMIGPVIHPLANLVQQKFCLFGWGLMHTPIKHPRKEIISWDKPRDISLKTEEEEMKK